MYIFLTIIAVLFTANAPIKVNKNNISVNVKMSSSTTVVPTVANKPVVRKEAPVLINRYFSQENVVVPWEKNNKSVDLISDVHVC